MGMGTGMAMDQGSSSNSSNSSMSMGMDMSMDPTCKMSMLWNWYTIDACFISNQWHIRSEVAFTFSVIFVFILVALVEGVRRFGREYDRTLVRQAGNIDSASGRLTKTNDLESPSPSAYVLFKLTHKQQLIRSLVFTVQFGAAFIIMLLVMQSNGFMIFAIILGGGVGHFVFGRDTVVGAISNRGKLLRAHPA